MLQIKLDDDIELYNAAVRAMNNSSLRLTFDQAQAEANTRRATVENSRAALDRLRDDARKAGVPAGWARWP